MINALKQLVRTRTDIELWPVDQDTQYCVSGQESKKDTWHTSVLFTGTVKLPNSAICISKTTTPISTKIIYFQPYIYTTVHITIKGNGFSISRDICS